jgi:N-acetylglutamate synthase-like GNAT family acetyltransferase
VEKTTPSPRKNNSREYFLPGGKTVNLQTQTVYMHEKISFRKAEDRDMERIYQIILQAREQMRLMNSRQWQDGYPAVENITSDIANGYGCVLSKEDIVIAYAAVIFDGEAAYNDLCGKWLTDFPYVVVHRLAVADEMKNKGVATYFMQEIEKLSRGKGIRSFRVDTAFENVFMQKLLSALDFTFCGQVYYNGNPRRAYEKIIG